MHLILAHRAQSRGEIRASRRFVLSTGLLSSCQGACSRDSMSHRDSPVRCCLLTACLFLAGKPCANAHVDLLSSSTPNGASPLRGKTGDRSIPRGERGSVGMEPSSHAPWSGVRWRYGRGGWVLAGALWVGYFQLLLVAVLSQVLTHHFATLPHRACVKRMEGKE